MADMRDDKKINRAVKKTWVAEEDKSLMRLIDIHGLTNWSLIAASMDSRTGKQCRERYFNHLQPNIKKGNWTEEEDQIIINMQAKIGNQWSAMTKYLPGRTDNAIKNRWHAIVKAQNQHDTNSVVMNSAQNVNVNVNTSHDNMMDPNRKMSTSFGYKLPGQSSNGQAIAPNTATAFYGTAQSSYISHNTNMRAYTPFEPPSDTDPDSSPFKASQMPASQMKAVPGFDQIMSRVADNTTTNNLSNNNNVNNSSTNSLSNLDGSVNNVTLDFLSYFFEKEMEFGKDSLPTDTSIDGNGMLYLNDTSIPANTASSTTLLDNSVTDSNGNTIVGAISQQQTLISSKTTDGLVVTTSVNNNNGLLDTTTIPTNENQQQGIFTTSNSVKDLLFDELDDNSGLVFDFSRVSLDFSLDDCNNNNLGEFDIALPSPITTGNSFKNFLTVSIPGAGGNGEGASDYPYCNVPLSHLPRTPRSPVLIDLKRTRF